VVNFNITKSILYDFFFLLKILSYMIPIKNSTMKLLHGNIDDIELLVIQNLNLISIIYPFEYLLSSFDYLLESPKCFNEYLTAMYTIMPYSKQMQLTASFLVKYFSFNYYHFKSLFMFTSLLYLTRTYIP
jgi:hypothetical protein